MRILAVMRLFPSWQTMTSMKNVVCTARFHMVFAETVIICQENGCVGVPRITPVAESMYNPSGRILQEKSL